jgi:hypothetical protein
MLVEFRCITKRHKTKRPNYKTSGKIASQFILSHSRKGPKYTTSHATLRPKLQKYPSCKTSEAIEGPNYETSVNTKFKHPKLYNVPSYKSSYCLRPQTSQNILNYIKSQLRAQRTYLII